jgi:hypothetical protein
MTYKISPIFLLTAFFCAGCISPKLTNVEGIPENEYFVLEKIGRLVEQEKFDEAVRLSDDLKKSESGKVLFALAYLHLARSQWNQNSPEKRTADDKLFLNYAEQAAIKELHDAPRLLEAVFKYGGYGTIQKHEHAATCWKFVVDGLKNPTQCVTDK